MAIRRLSDLTGTPKPRKPGKSGTPAPAGDAKAPGRALVPTQAPTAPIAPAAAPPDGPAALLAELNDLNETLDEVATLVANMSGRVNDQTDALGQLARTAAETRQAAFHAKAQTDPKLFQEAVNVATRDTLHRLGAVTSALTTEQREARQADQVIQKELATLKSALHVVLLADIERQKRRKRQLPLLATGALLLMLALGLLLPRLAVLHPMVCSAISGDPRDDRPFGGLYDACTIRFR